MTRINRRTKINRRQVLQGLSASTVFSPLVIPRAAAQGAGDIVIGASQPITGIFSFAGVAMNMGLNDFVQWKNANGGVAGRKLRYVAEDSGFKLDQGVTIFKKIMASDKPSFFYGDSTQWVKAITQDAVTSNSIITSSPSLASVVADAKEVPQNIVPGPTYPKLHEILMEHIAATSGGSKPKIAYVYADTEFGRDGIPGGKARAQKLGLSIVEEIVTKQSGIDVTPEVAKLRRANPDIVIFQGYIAAPMPEFVRQMKEAGVTPKVMGTAWGLDRPAYDGLGALGAQLTGISMYRYGHETDSPMINSMREHLAKNRPEVKSPPSPFYINAWFAGMIFAEIAERTLKAGKPLDLASMKATLESLTDWDTGGIMGLPADCSTHQIPVGRMYSYDLTKKTMEPAGQWLKV